MNKERMRNEDARGGDVIVQDSVANGRPDLPIDRDPGRETAVGIDADELGQGAEKIGGRDIPPTSDFTPRDVE